MSRATRLAPIFLGISLLISLPARAGGRSLGHETSCRAWGLAHLRESPSCRAFYLSAQGTRLCANERSWLNMVADSRLLSGCQTWTGRWRSPESAEGIRSLLLFSPELELAPLTSWIERLRLRMSESLRGRDPLGICRKLLLDEAANPPAANLLRLLGFVHILSATGIHLYCLSLLLSLALRRLLQGTGLSAGSAVILSNLLGVALWLACWVLAGLRPGMLRPLLLVAARTLGGRLGLRWRTYSALLFAVAFDALAAVWRLDPSPYRLGYALAVAGGMAGLQALGGGLSHLKMAVGSWIFLGLLEATRTSLLALATPALSLASIPVFGFLVYPLLLLATAARALSLSGFSEGLASAAASLAGAFIENLAKLALAESQLWTVRPAVLAAALLTAAPIAALTARARMRTTLGVAAVLATAVSGVRLTVAATAHPGALAAARGAWVEQLSVGQGDAALVYGADGRAGLIDAGSFGAKDSAHWIEMLAHSGVTHLNWIALTHLDEDHSGGLLHLLQILRVECVESAREQWDQPRGRVLAALLVRAGVAVRNWGSGCVPYPTLAPVPRRGPSRANSAMGAVWIPLPEGDSYLSAGDATREDEPRIGRWADERSRSWEKLFPLRKHRRVLKISHHGSKTSSSPSFLRAFAPTEAWISVGRGNLYGHPHPSVLARLKLFRIPVHRTDAEGTLKLGLRLEK